MKLNVLNTLFDKGYVDFYKCTLADPYYIADYTLTKTGWYIKTNTLTFDVGDFISENKNNIPICYISSLNLSNTSTLSQLYNSGIFPILIGSIRLTVPFTDTSIHVQRVEISTLESKFEADIRLVLDSDGVSSLRLHACPRLRNLDGLNIDGLEANETTLYILKCPSLLNISNIKTKIHELYLDGQSTDFVFTTNEFDRVEICYMVSQNRFKGFENICSLYGLDTSSIRINKRLTIHTPHKIKDSDHSVILEQLQKLADIVGVSGAEFIFMHGSSSVVSYVKP